MTHRHPRPRCRPPPLSLTHMHKYTNTPTHILISTSNLHSFRNISPVFSSPAEQMLAVCVSLPLDCTNRLPEVFFFFFCTASLLFSELSSQAVRPRPSISALWFRCWFTTSPWAASPSNPLLHHPNIPTLNVFPRVRQRARSSLIFYLPQNVSSIISPSWWILSSRSSCRHSSPLLCFSFFFFQPLVSSLETFHRAVCQKHLRLRFYRPPALFWHSLFLLSFQPSGTSLCKTPTYASGYNHI